MITGMKSSLLIVILLTVMPCCGFTQENLDAIVKQSFSNIDKIYDASLYQLMRNKYSMTHEKYNQEERRIKEARISAKQRIVDMINNGVKSAADNTVYKSMKSGSVDAIITGPPSGLTLNEDEALTAGPGEKEENTKRQANLDRQRWQNQAESRVEDGVIGNSTSIKAQEMRDRIRSGGYTPGDRNRIDSENRDTIFNMRFDAEQEQRKKGDDSWKNRGNDIIQRQEEQRKKDDESGQRLRERITPFSWER